ncbi:MAG: endolytic transglycosylase MltG [Syntrophales bacterium]|nr:endolytic transglycosylase MltG [Syntrophales bacterium]
MIKRILKTASVHRRETALLLILVATLAGVAFSRYATSSVDRLIVTKIVDIPKGAGFFRITEIMNDAGFVANRPFFWLLAIGKGATKHIRAGEYEFVGSQSPAEILDKLVRGEIKSYTVMLPEDITVNDIAKRLIADKLINEKEFMALTVDREFLGSLGIEAESIEGYLFPETYQFDRSMTTREVIRIIVRQFWKEITPEMSQRAEKIGLTLNEWLTLASIIGKESGNKDEKPVISAVFHNRLKRGMKLQSDPTAVYHLEQAGTPVKTVLRSHLKKNTPHNTYLIDGLPPGPIANPGIDSLRAALYPANVNYLYFVSKNDGSHQFSVGLDSHNQAVSKYQINRQKK